jgi:hypothetical protein
MKESDDACNSMITECAWRLKHVIVRTGKIVDGIPLVDETDIERRAGRSLRARAELENEFGCHNAADLRPLQWLVSDLRHSIYLA